MAGKQDYQTPPQFTEAIAKRFGRATFDLAATEGQQIVGASEYFTPEVDSLKQSWANLGTKPGPKPRVVFLNPPFSKIAPWAGKLTSECRWLQRWTLMLVPASVGSEWYRKHVHGKALVLGLSPRLTFVGERTPYPKDLMLVCVGFGAVGFDTWRWDRAITCPCGDPDAEDPGPGHVADCPWSDPGYDGSTSAPRALERTGT